MSAGDELAMRYPVRLQLKTPGGTNAPRFYLDHQVLSQYTLPAPKPGLMLNEELLGTIGGETAPLHIRDLDTRELTPAGPGHADVDIARSLRTAEGFRSQGMFRIPYLPKHRDFIDQMDSWISLEGSDPRLLPERKRPERAVKTGEEAIWYFCGPVPEDGPKVIYCNYRSMPYGEISPYDLVVVDHDDIDEEHYAVSASGVMFVRHDDAEVFTFDEWLSHRSTYNLLKKTPFFKNFLLYRSFHRWYRNVRSMLFHIAQKKIEADYLPLSPIFGPSFWSVRTAAASINGNTRWRRLGRRMWAENGDGLASLGKHLGTFNIPGPCQIQDFQTFRTQKVEMALAAIAKVEALAARELVDVKEAVVRENEHMVKALTGKGGTLESSKKAKWRSESFASRKETQKKARAQKQRSEQLQVYLTNFTRLVDSVIVGELRSLAVESCERFLQELFVERKATLFAIAGGMEAGRDYVGADVRAFFNPSAEVILGLLAEIPATIFRLIASRGRVCDAEVGIAEHDYIPISRILARAIDVEGIQGKARAVVHRDYDLAISNDIVQKFQDTGLLYAFADSWTEQDYTARNPTPNDFAKDITTIRQWGLDLTKGRSLFSVGMLFFDTSRLTAHLLIPANRTLDGLTSLLAGNFITHCRTVTKWIQAQSEVLQGRPTELRSFGLYVVDARHHTLESGQGTTQMASDVLTATTLKDLLSQGGETGPWAAGSECQVWWEMMEEMTNQYYDSRDGARDYIAAYMKVAVDLLEKEADDLTDELKDVVIDARSGVLVDPVGGAAVAKAKIAQYRVETGNATVKARALQELQVLFGSERLDKMENVLDGSKTALASREAQWEAIYRWIAFMDKIGGINVLGETPESSWFEEEIQALLGAIAYDPQRVPCNADMFAFGDSCTPKELAFVEVFAAEANTWKAYTSVLRELCDPALQVRHWSFLLKELNMSMQDRLSMKDLLAMGVLDQKQLIHRVWHRAVQEAILTADIDGLNAGVHAYELLFSKEDVYGKLDNLKITNIKEMQANFHKARLELEKISEAPFLKGVEGTFLDLEEDIIRAYESLDACEVCQKEWEFFAVVFCNPTYRECIPEVRQEFDKVHSEWTRVTYLLSESPKVLTSFKDKNLLGTCLDLSTKLSNLRLGCSDLVVHLRSSFPRFNFIGDELLLEAAAAPSAWDIKAEILHAVFPGVSRIGLQDDAEGHLLIVGVRGEEFLIPFEEAEEYSPEAWLASVLASLKATFHRLFLQCLKGCALMTSDEWMSTFPMQCILLVDEIVWTDSVNAALQAFTDGNKFSLRNMHNQCTKRIDKMASRAEELIRQEEQVPLEERRAFRARLNGLQALIMTGIHHRQTIERLIEGDISNADDYEWLRNMRYYWDTEQNVCTVKTGLLSQIEYGFEYVGDDLSIIMLPNLNFMLQAASMLGSTPFLVLQQDVPSAAPQHLAASLAKACGQFYVEIPCTSTIEMSSLGRILAGIATTSAWSYFNDANTLLPEVMSDLALQLYKIQTAFKGNEPVIELRGLEIPLQTSGKKSFCCFLSTETVHENLSDIALWPCRNLLMSYPKNEVMLEATCRMVGSLEATKIARSVITTLKLASQHLPEVHCLADTTATTLALIHYIRLCSKTDTLENVIDRALKLFVVSSLTVPQRHTFTEIWETCMRRKVAGDEEPKAHHQLLDELVAMNQCILVTGGPGSGKSRTIATCLEQEAARRNPWTFRGKHIVGSDLAHHRIYHGSLPFVDTVGGYEAGVWVDGLIPHYLKSFVPDKFNPKNNIVVFDGNMLAAEVDVLKSLLECSFIVLPNGEIVQQPPSMKIVIETMSLESMSPGFVRFAGILHCQRSSTPLGELVERLSYLANSAPFAEREHWEAVFREDGSLARLCGAIRSQLHDAKPYVDEKALALTEKLLKHFLPAYAEAEAKDDLDRQGFIELLVAYCASWGYGGALPEDLKDQIAAAVAANLRREAFTIVPERDFNIFGYRLDIKNRTVVPWEQVTIPDVYSFGMFDMLYPSPTAIRSSTWIDILLKCQSHVFLAGKHHPSTRALINNSIARVPAGQYQTLWAQLHACYATADILAFLDSHLEPCRDFLRPKRAKKVLVSVIDLHVPRASSENQGISHASDSPPEIHEWLRENFDSLCFYDPTKKSKCVVLGAQYIVTGDLKGGESVHRLLRHLDQLEVSDPALNSLDGMEAIFSFVLGQNLKAGNGHVPGAVRQVATAMEKCCVAAIPVYSQKSICFAPYDMMKKALRVLGVVAKLGSILQCSGWSETETLTHLGHVWAHEAGRVFLDDLTEEAARKRVAEDIVSSFTACFNGGTESEQSRLAAKIVQAGDFSRAEGMQAVTSDLLRERARAALDSCPPGSLAPEARAGTKCLGLPRATENITHVLHYLKASGSCILVGRPFSGQAAIASTVSLLMKATLVTTLWRKGITAAELHEQVAGAVRAAGAGTVLLHADQNLTAKDELLGVLHDTIQHLNVNAASGNRLLQGAKLNNLRILMEMSTERYQEMAALYPGLGDVCGVQCMQEGDDNETFYSILSIIKNTASIEQGLSYHGWHMPSVSWALVRMYHAACDVCAHSRHPMQIAPQDLWDFVSNLGQYVAKQSEALTLKIRFLSGALETFDEAVRNLDDAKDKINELEPKLGHYVSNATECVLEISELERIGDKMKIEIVEDEVRQQERYQEMLVLQQEAEDEVMTATSEYEESMAEVLNLADKDIKELKSYKRPPGLVKIVVEAVCLLFNWPSEWKAARQLLTDTEQPLLARIQSFDLESMTSTTRKEIKKVVESSQFKPSAVEQVSQAAKSICEWVLAVHGYSEATLAAKDKTERIYNIRIRTEASGEALLQKQETMQDMEHKLSKLQMKHSQILSQQSWLNEERIQVEEKVRVLENLIESFSEQILSWRREQMALQAALQSALGSSMLTSACCAFSGPLPPNERAALLDSWKHILTEQNIKHEASHSLLRYVEEAQRVPKYWPDELLHACDIDNIVLLDISAKKRLLIDPDNIAMALVEQVFPDTKWMHLTTSEDYSFGQVHEFLRDGDNVIFELEDVTLDTLLDMQPLLDTGEACKGQVIFITHCAYPELHPQAYQSLSIINLEKDPRGVQEELLNTVMDEVFPHSFASLKSLRREWREHIKERFVIEQRFITRLANSKTSLWNEIRFVEELAEEVDLLRGVQAALEGCEAQIGRLNEERHKFFPVAKLFQVIYSGMELKVLNFPDTISEIPLWQFCPILAQALQHVAAASEAEGTDVEDIPAEALQTQTCRYIYRALSLRCTEDSRIALGMLLSCQVLLSNGQIREEEWQFAQDLMGAEDQNSTDALHDELLDLATSFPSDVFEPLLDGPGPVEEVALKGSALLVDGREVALSPFHAMVAMNALHPDKRLGTCEWFVQTVIGTNAQQDQASQICSAADQAEPTTPIIAYGCGGENCPRPLLYASRLFHLQNPGLWDQAWDGMSVLSVGFTDPEETRAVLQRAWKQGRWVAFLNCERNPDRAASLVRKELRQWLAHSSTPHPNFRLWLCFEEHGMDRLPGSLLSLCATCSVEPCSNVRSGVIRAFESVQGDNALLLAAADAEGSAWRKHAFGLALLHAVLRQRQEYGKLGYQRQVAVGDLDFLAALDACRAMFAPSSLEFVDKPSLFDYTAINSLLIDIHMPLFTSLWDARCCRSLLEKFVTHDILTPSYIVSDPTGKYLETMPAMSDHLEVRQFVEHVVYQNGSQEMFMSISDLARSQVEHKKAKFHQHFSTAAPGVLFNFNNQNSSFVLKLRRQLADVLNLVAADGAAPGAAPPDPLQALLARTVVAELAGVRRHLEKLLDELEEMRLQLAADAPSAAYVAVLDDLVAGRVPAGWLLGPKVCKTLEDFFRHFMARARFLGAWSTLRPPERKINLAFFTRPHLILTDVKMLFSATADCLVEDVGFVAKIFDTNRRYAPKSAMGPLIIQGVHLAGACWDATNRCLAEIGTDGEHGLQELPDVSLVPMQIDEMPVRNQHYTTPVYLSYSGDAGSGEALWEFHLKSRKFIEFWVRRGCSAFAMT